MNLSEGAPHLPQGTGSVHDFLFKVYQHCEHESVGVEAPLPKTSAKALTKESLSLKMQATLLGQPVAELCTKASEPVSLSVSSFALDKG